MYKYVLAKFLLIEFKVRLPVKIFEFKQRILDHKCDTGAVQSQARAGRNIIYILSDRRSGGVPGAGVISGDIKEHYVHISQ